MKKLSLLLLLTLPLFLRGSTKDTCYAGLYIKNMYDIRPEEYSYVANFWVWFNYNKQAFDPLKNVEIINSKEVIYTDTYYAKANGRTLVASESGKVTLIHDWQLKNYPFDRQVLKIELEAGLDTSKMILEAAPAGFKLYQNLDLPGWSISSFDVKNALINYDTDFGETELKGRSTFSRLHYEVIIQRHSWGLFFKLLIGLYISFFVAYLVFFVPPARDQRFGLSIGGLFAAVGNKYVMDNNIPATISFSFIDKIHDLTFFFILATLVFSIISLKISENSTVAKAMKFDRKCAWYILGCYLLINIVLIIQANVQT